MKLLVNMNVGRYFGLIIKSKLIYGNDTDEFEIVKIGEFDNDVTIWVDELPWNY